MRKVPAEQAELMQEESGEPEGPNRFASAKFTVRLQPKDKPSGQPSDQEETEVEQPD